MRKTQAQLDNELAEYDRTHPPRPAPAGADKWTSNGKPPCEPDQKPGYVYHALTSAEFAAAKYELDWAVKRIMVMDQPMIIGGPSKTLKTSIAIDLAISLGTATPFLGEFKVYKQRRVLIVSGESGENPIQSTANRVCQARGVNLKDANVRWSFALPAIGIPEQLAELARGIKQDRIEVAVIDPLYLTLLAGGVDASASNLFDMGPLLAAVTKACRDAGAMPVLCHHSRQNIPLGKTPTLEDLAFAGCQQFARQWILLNRVTEWQGDGRHDLLMLAGGSAGHGGLWRVNVDEGILGEDLTGRKWNVGVVTAGQANATEADQRRAIKEKADAEKLKALDAQFLNVCDTIDASRQGTTLRAVRTTLGWNNDKADGCRMRLLRDEILEAVDVKYESGGGAKKTTPGFRRKAFRATNN